MQLPVKPISKPQRRLLIPYEANELSGWLRSSSLKRETERGVWTAVHALVKSVELEVQGEIFTIAVACSQSSRVTGAYRTWIRHTDMGVPRLQRPALKLRQIGLSLDTLRTPSRDCWLLRWGRKGHWLPPGCTRRHDSHVGLNRLFTGICHRLMSMTSKRLPA